MRRDVFQAIADPTRRAILSLLAVAPMNVNAVADQFHISRPAVSKHMKILAECGLVAISQQGRERVCQARLENLSQVAAFVEKYRHFWEAKLDALDGFLSETKKS